MPILLHVNLHVRFSPLDRVLEGVFLEKELIRFLLGEVKAVDLGGGNIASSDQITNTWWQIIISHNGEALFRLNYNPKVKQGKNKPPPKNTGGKKSYIMLMTKELKKLKKSDVENKIELIGFLTYMSDYIEWGTGKLINKRTKKPLKYDDLLQISELNNRKLNTILADLKRLDLLEHTPEGYFISQIIAKKGKTIKKEADRDGQ